MIMYTARRINLNIQSSGVWDYILFLRVYNAQSVLLKLREYT